MPITEIREAPRRIGADFARDGFAVLPGFFSEERIANARRCFDDVRRNRAGELVVDSRATGRRSFWRDAEDPAVADFKFNDVYLLDTVTRELALDAELSPILDACLGEPAVLCNSLHFEKGSGQPMHIDSLYMTPRSPHGLIASWIALEDVHPDSGPLWYWRGSHRIPLFRFKDGSHHVGLGEQGDWDRYMAAELASRGLEPETFMAKRGDVFLWHADVVHAGSPIRDAARTRASIVCHYYRESDARALGYDLVPLNDAYWYERLGQPVRVGVSAFAPDGSDFPAERYLRRYPDVEHALRRGLLRSAWAHFREHGAAEGRGV